MILIPSERLGASRTTLDQLLALNAQRAGDSLALFDAPDRPLWTDGAPRRLTWSQIDTAATATAQRLAEMGLSADSVVAIQGPNSSDMLVAILGCLRARLIAAPMPLGWRNAEVAAAVARIGAKAIFTATRAGPVLPADLLRYVAAENFSIRFVCAFGHEVPDGIVPFEDCIADPKPTAAVRPPVPGNPAEHVAIITWDCGPRGVFPVARSHNEWLAAAMFALPGRQEESATAMLSTLSPATFAGLATGMMPWLMTGAALALHQAFDATVFGVQIERHQVGHIVLPAVAGEAVLREGLLPANAAGSVLAVHRHAYAGLGPVPDAERIKDIAVFGEIGLLPLARGEDGPGPFTLGPVPVTFEGQGIAIETALDKAGMLALRGAHVPRAAFPGSGSGDQLPISAEGWISTAFPAALVDGRLKLEGPRRDLVSIGGQSLALAAIESIYSDVPGAISVNATATTDRILGQRLVLEAMPQPGTDLSAVSLIMHAEEKAVTPLAATADALVGDRRRNARLAGAA